jgi:hypothetical protein
VTLCRFVIPSLRAKCGNPWLLTASIAMALRYLAMTADSLSGNF